MSGLLDLYAEQAGPSGPALIQPPSTPGERWDASMDAAFAPDLWSNIGAARRERHQQVVDALQTATGQTFANPYGPVTGEEMMRLGNQPALIEERKAKIREARNTLLQDAGVGDVIPDPDLIDRQIGEEGDRLRQRAGSLVGTGNGMAAFAAGALAPTPENIIGMMIPPSRAVFGAKTAMQGFFVGLGREAAYQGAAMGTLTAASEALSAASRSETGTAPSLGEVVGNVAEGAAGGALIGGAFHVLHAGPRALWERWTALPEAVRERAPLEVRDAAKVLEQESLYAAGNRLGLPWAEHDKLERDAFGAVLRGRPVEVGDIQPASSPMTALGTILRNAPEAVNAAADLSRAVAGVARLSDEDLAPIVRELKPGSFKALDAVNAKIAALDERVSAIQREADQIGVPDIVDLDTAALINDAVENLKRTDLTRRQREAYEHQRDTWLQSIDAHGGLTDELARMRTEFFPEHGPALKEIAAEREKLQRELKLAQGEAQREIDFLRSKLDRLETGETPRAGPTETAADLGFKEPADFARALEAADFERQIRMAAQVPREGSGGPAAVKGQTRPEVAKDGQIKPEAAKAIEAAAQAVMEGKGALGDFKGVITRELKALDAELADARAAMACAGKAAG